MGLLSKQTGLTSRYINGYGSPMTNDIERYRQAQRDRLAELRTLVADRPAHARFLERLEDTYPGEILEDIELPRGVTRKVADALIADVEWVTAEAPEPGMSASPFPGAYKALRLKAARSSAQAARTRADNVTWSGFSFGGK